MHKTRLEGHADLQNRVRQRFQEPIETLVPLGFEELCIYGETLNPFSALFQFSLYRMMREAGEIVRIHGLLRFSAYFPLMISREHSSYGLVFGLGVKFYTLFQDGTGLITGTMIINDVADDQANVFRFAGPKNIIAAWRFHREKIMDFVKAGKAIENKLTYESFAAISSREERLLQG